MRALISAARGDELEAEPVIRAIEATLASNSLDSAFKAEAILLPSDPCLLSGWDRRSRRNPCGARPFESGDRQRTQG